MSMNFASGKKRKAEINLEQQNTLHNKFVTAANALSGLYSHALQQQQVGRDEGEQAAYEKTFNFISAHYGNAAYVPTEVVLEFLRHEMQNVGKGQAVQQPLPGHMQQPGSFIMPHMPSMATLSPIIESSRLGNANGDHMNTPH